MGTDPRHWRGLAGVRRGLLENAAIELSSDFRELGESGGDGGGYSHACRGERGFREAPCDFSISHHGGANNLRHPRQGSVNSLKILPKPPLRSPPNRQLNYRQTPANPRQKAFEDQIR